jgi:hypothetical protein
MNFNTDLFVAQTFLRLAILPQPTPCNQLLKWLIATKFLPEPDEFNFSVIFPSINKLAKWLFCEVV